MKRTSEPLTEQRSRRKALRAILKGLRKAEDVGASGDEDLVSLVHALRPMIKRAEAELVRTEGFVAALEERQRAQRLDRSGKLAGHNSDTGRGTS